ncbi:hypothetical protein L9F63_017052 [Diploptera punctata]|uniref:Uncharacterized protein n=1 Tax=Diploptera punctata TaxID=6984 RepID=A0AAD8EGI8_DIPPU|nr:hypothetical protein L9F63_017052 [Diploptera punctata]
MNIANLKLTTVTQHSTSSIPYKDATKMSVVRETHSFTGAMEELKRDSAVNCLDQVHNTGFVEGSCNKYKFCTYEKDSMKSYVFGPEILFYQGNRHTPAEIAPIWKKDCRMWLWKSVSNARKKRKQLKLN